jgi:hypothetical protein
MEIEKIHRDLTYMVYVQYHTVSQQTQCISLPLIWIAVIIAHCSPLL